MPKFLIIKPWRDGQKKGDVVELSKFHPSLVSHIEPFQEEQKAPVVTPPEVDAESDSRGRKKRDTE